jgi:hypothetical protein
MLITEQCGLNKATSPGAIASVQAGLIGEKGCDRSGC